MPGRLYCQTSPTHLEMYNTYINTGIRHEYTAVHFILILSNTIDTGFETAPPRLAVSVFDNAFNRWSAEVNIAS